MSFMEDEGEECDVDVPSFAIKTEKEYPLMKCKFEYENAMRGLCYEM